jgi:pimeloyl-ACP methyl ester carboxylesterase
MFGDAAGQLPGPEQKVRDAIAVMAQAPRDDEARIDRAVKMWRALSDTMGPLDEQEVRAREKRVLARARDIDAAMNHQLAIASSPDRTDALAEIRAPTLVIHGTADPILPFLHGEATAKAIPGASLLPIGGMGHELPPPAASIVAAAIVEHTR